MGIQQYQTWAEDIEKQVYKTIITGTEKGLKKKELIEDLTEKLFHKHFCSDARICGEGVFITRHILIGGITAAGSINWAEEKAVKKICTGLLKSLNKHEKNYIQAATILIRGTVQAALLSGYDACAMVEEAIAAILKVGKNKPYNPTELVKAIARAGVSASSTFPQKGTAKLEKMMVSLLEEQRQVA